MLHKVSMLAAGGVGYVLGAKAGRERFEQIRHAVGEAPLARDKVMAAAEKIRHGEMPGLHLGHNGRTPQSGPIAPPFDDGLSVDDPDLRGPA